MTLPHDVARCTGRIKTAQTAFDMSDAPTPSRHYECARWIGERIRHVDSIA